LLRPDHAGVEVNHGLAVRAFHARQEIHRGGDGQMIQQFVVFPGEFELQANSVRFPLQKRQAGHLRADSGLCPVKETEDYHTDFLLRNRDGQGNRIKIAFCRNKAPNDGGRKTIGLPPSRE
jgi:hypothetical protein